VRRLLAAQPPEAAAERSTAETEKRQDRVRSIRACVFAQEDGSLGTVCIIEAESPEAIREHAAAADPSVTLADLFSVIATRAAAAHADRNTSTHAQHRWARDRRAEWGAELRPVSV
jgi:hypothetical protein